jgi:uncharacterized membrane protein
MKPAMRDEGTVGRLPERIAAGLAYVTFIPAIVFLLLDPYRKNRVVRYHSIQCLLFCVAILAVAAFLRLVGLVLSLIPVLGPLLMYVIPVVAAIAAGLVWLVLVVKALQGEMFKLPALGDVAEHYAGQQAIPGA